MNNKLKNHYKNILEGKIMNFRQIAEQNRKFLMGSSSLINERVGPPRPPRIRPIRPIRRLEDILPKPHKVQDYFDNKPLRDFFKEVFGDQWRITDFVSDSQGLVLEQVFARRLWIENLGILGPRLNDRLKGLLPDGVHVVEVTYYNSGHIMVKDNTGIWHILIITPDGSTILIPTTLPNPPINANPLNDPKQILEITNPANPGMIKPGSGNSSGNSGGVNPALLAPLILPFAQPNTAPANPFSPYEVPQELPPYPGGQPWDPYQEYEPQYDDPNDLQAPGY